MSNRVKTKIPHCQNTSGSPNAAQSHLHTSYTYVCAHTHTHTCLQHMFLSQYSWSGWNLRTMWHSTQNMHTFTAHRALLWGVVHEWHEEGEWRRGAERRPLTAEQVGMQIVPDRNAEQWMGYKVKLGGRVFSVTFTAHQLATKLSNYHIKSTSEFCHQQNDETCLH